MKNKKDLVKKHEITEGNMEYSPAEKNEILKQRADLLKKGIKKEGAKGEKLEVLEFVLANEKYLIDTRYVTEVIPLKELTPLPCTPEFIQGIINVRGKVIAVNDLKKFIDLPEEGGTDLKRVIIVKHRDIELGILVDEIIGCTHIFLDKLQASVPTMNGIKNDCLKGVTEDRLILLNMEKILTSEIIIVNEEV